MAHTIEGFIGRQAGFRATLAAFPSAHIVQLPQDFALLPLSHSLSMEVTAHFGNVSLPAYPEFGALTPQLTLLGNELSLLTPIAYVETEYFGGPGSQGSIVWDLGRVVLGPLRTGDAREWEFSPVADVALCDRAINQALRYLGVKSVSGVDEFSALGLHRHRSNDEWLRMSVP